MASKNKQKKLKNSYCVGGALKNKTIKLKKILFYTASQRQHLKKELKNNI